MPGWSTVRDTTFLTLLWQYIALSHKEFGEQNAVLTTGIGAADSSLAWEIARASSVSMQAMWCGHLKPPSANGTALGVALVVCAVLAIRGALGRETL